MSDTTKKTAILIHGYGFDHRTWYPVEIAFEGHHVIYLALPGFGMEPVTEPYSISGLADKYWRHINDVVSEPVHLVGHSMGGYVCMEMVAQQPARVSSIALIHSHVFEDPQDKKDKRSATMKEIGSNGRETFINKFIPSLFGNPDRNPLITKMLIERGMVFDDNAWIFGAQAMRDRVDHSTTLKNISVPVLMIMGEKDAAVTPELAYKQAPMSERVTLHMYPGVGHLAMYEHTSGMIEDLIRFYDMHAA